VTSSPPFAALQTIDQVTASVPQLRELLRDATRDVHERLHLHRGLAAVQAGTIDRAAYTALLNRLYGFHDAFEIGMQVAPDRTRWLACDLAVLGVTSAVLNALPRCLSFPTRACPHYVLGARYVIEGSALGGRGLARQLDDLLGIDTSAGRRFFIGNGAATGVIWRSYLTELSIVPRTAADRAAVLAGATATFAIFEQWLEGWELQR
jgi:heme oxygenase